MEGMFMTKAGSVETYIGVFILLVLAGILASILFVQSRYDPAIFNALETKGSPGQNTPASPGVPAAAYDGQIPTGLVLAGAGETFGPETLSDKIDGKAELYLSSGFVTLSTQRFSRAGDPNSWFELFIYEMGNARNAFSVFSLQKRRDAGEAGLGTLAYTTDNALFMVSGSRYIEIVAAETNLSGEMHALAENILAKQPAESAGAVSGGESDLFPSEFLDRGSIALHMSDVFGCAGLENVYTARYKPGNEELTAFLSKRKSGDESAGIAAQYSRFLLENGAKEIGELQGVPGSRIFQLFDTFEAVLHRGVYFAGVHEADSRDAAEELALRIFRGLEGTAR